jgi:hypothetical protein
MSSRPIRIYPDVSEWIHARMDARLNTPNKVLRDFFGLPVPDKQPRAFRPGKPRVSGMTLILTDGRRIEVLRPLGVRRPTKERTV